MKIEDGKNIIIKQMRAEIVKHELLENYYRTTHKMSYMEAHEKANNTFNGDINGEIYYK